MTHDLFATAVKKAITQDLNVMDLLTAVEQLRRDNETVLLLELYRVWLTHNAVHPLAYAVHFNLGVSRSDAGDLPGAREALEAAIALNPQFLPAHINLGGVLERLGLVEQAIAQWSLAADGLAGVSADAITHKTTALKQIGRVLETSRIEARAEEVLRQSLEINPRQRDVIQHWIALRQTQCKWPLFDGNTFATTAELMQAISPLSLATFSADPLFQLASAHHYNKRDIKSSVKPVAQAARASVEDPGRRLRIGYVSSDLREHAVGFLMSEVFELHNRDAVEVYAYYCGIQTDDATKRRFVASADHWRDLHGLSDEAAAARIADDGVDILVDLNGYTKDARLNVFAMRPAPILVNWLGFPGTMGSAYHNYIVADPVTIPAGSEGFYSEKVLRLPCYQPNDRKRVVSPITPTRSEAGLPDNAFVYCCFNGTQKVTRPTFASWMDILKRTQNSVLWLLTGTPETNARLCDLAEAHGIARDRLVFAPKKANPDHLARYALADVFLDTSPYGAHTTASDALWMGIPVLTVPGPTFASRVCASLTSAAGLGELVCATREDYVASAVALAGDRARLTALKARLAKNRDTCVLFDTPALVRHLEGLYRQAWREFVAGDLHRPDLSGLEVLHEIGCQAEHEALQDLAAHDHLADYRAACAARHAFQMLEHDPRLNGGVAEPVLASAVPTTRRAQRSDVRSDTRVQPPNSALFGSASSEVTLQ